LRWSSSAGHGALHELTYTHIHTQPESIKENYAGALRVVICLVDVLFLWISLQMSVIGKFKSSLVFYQVLPAVWLVAALFRQFSIRTSLFTKSVVCFSPLLRRSASLILPSHHQNSSASSHVALSNHIVCSYEEKRNNRLSPLCCYAHSHTTIHSSHTRFCSCTHTHAKRT
jgi:hypothetical protein